MKVARELIILCFVSFAFIYIISLFSFNPGSKSLLYYPYPTFEGAAFFGGFGNLIASFSFFLVGKSAYFFSIPLFMFIVALIFQKKAIMAKVGWMFLLVISTSGFYGAFSSSSEIIQGGLIGNICGLVFKNLFGIVGTTLIVFLANVLVLYKLFPKINQRIQETIKKTNRKKHEPSVLEENTVSEKNTDREQSVISLPFQEKKSTVFQRYEDYKKESENTASQNFPVIEYHADVKQEDPIKKQKPVIENQSESIIVMTPVNVELDENQYRAEKHGEEKLSYNYDEMEPEIPSDKEILGNFKVENTQDHKDLFDEIEETEDNEEFKNFKEMEEGEELLESDFEFEGKKTEIKTENQQPDRHPNIYKLAGNFEFPPLSLLKEGEKQSILDETEIRRTGEKLLAILREFNIEASLGAITTGPVVTRYEIIPPKGLKVSKIVSLTDNIAMGIASVGKIRIEAPIPGKSAIGIEVANKNRQMVVFKDLAELQPFKGEKRAIPFVLGQGISGNPIFTDISKIPHLLIAGSTGSGKSVCINSLICSILYSKRPDELKMLMVDPKRVELKMYDGLPHLIAPVIKETSQAIAALNWAVNYMEERYKTLEKYNARNIASYNAIKRQEKQTQMPYLLLVIDEFADLMMIGGKEIEDPIIRLAAMARAVGIHLVLATQRPSVDVITGLIKANFPGRIAFKVSSKMESRIILDMNGAENLLGKGDMLFSSPETSSLKRIQSPFISDDEVYQITEFYKARYKPSYWDEVLEHAESAGSASSEASDPSEEPLFDEAVNIVMKERKASASYLQRRLKIGYNRAARIIEMMEEMGIVGGAVGSKPREVLMESW